MVVRGLKRDIRELKVERDRLSDPIRAEWTTTPPTVLKALRKTRDEHNQTLANWRAQVNRLEAKAKRRR